MWDWMSNRKSLRGQERIRIAPRLSARSEPQPLRGAFPQIAAEFARARRYERPVTVAVLAMSLGDAGLPAACVPPVASVPGGEQPVGPACALVVRGAVREIDIVSCDTTSGWCIVVMPEIGAEEGQRAVARMRQACTDRLGTPVLAGMAVYPRDGWTFLDLVETAKRTTAEQPRQSNVSVA